MFVVRLVVAEIIGIQILRLLGRLSYPGHRDLVLFAWVRSCTGWVILGHQVSKRVFEAFFKLTLLVWQHRSCRLRLRRGALASDCCRGSQICSSCHTNALAAAIETWRKDFAGP